MSWFDWLKSQRETLSTTPAEENRATAPNWGRYAKRDWMTDVQQLVTQASPVIVDAGAAGGGMTRRLLECFPNATVHAFEPLPHRLKQLHERFGQNPRVQIHPLALGPEPQQVVFHVAANQDSSSILQPGHISDAYHGNKTATGQSITVKQVRLDDAISQPIDILKMDLQGYELQALRGCTQQLKHIKAVILEVEFVPLYDNQPLFAEIDIFMREHHYRLLNLYGLFTQKDGQLTSGDALYLNKTIFGEHGGMQSSKSS